MHTIQHGIQQAQQCRQIAQQLIQQTQQGNQQYRQMIQQEQQNVQMLEQILQREKQAVHNLEQSLRSHEVAIQRCQEIVNICDQMQHSVTGASAYGFQSQTAMNQPMTNQNNHQFQQGHYMQSPFQQ
jgi:paraquat-inducible protein B